MTNKKFKADLCLEKVGIRTTSTDGNACDSPLPQDLKAATDHNQQALLLSLPNEVKQKIWAYAVQVEEPIEPLQLRSRSNKFIWSKSQTYHNSIVRNVSAVPPLTVVQLSKICHQIYDEVAGTHIFYKVNQFSFREPEREKNPPLLTYLAAITMPRLRAIRKISHCHWPYLHSMAEAFTLLAACRDLQELHLVINYEFGTSDPRHLPGFKELLGAVHGLKVLTVVDAIPPVFIELYWFEWRLAKQKARREAVKSFLEEEMKQPRSATILMTKIRNAREITDLDINGDGRLDEDRKPGVVASRTRQQVRNLERIDADGVVPRTRPVSKYDADGNLTWKITKVLEAKEAILDNGTVGVEFCIQCDRDSPEWVAADTSSSPFWEQFTTLDTQAARHELANFYEENPKAYGKQIVLDTWDAGNIKDIHLKRVRRRLQYIVRQEAVDNAAAEKNLCKGHRQDSKH